MILLILSTRIARLAQLVERLTVNQDVTGPSPVSSAMLIKKEPFGSFFCVIITIGGIL